MDDIEVNMLVQVAIRRVKNPSAVSLRVPGQG